MLIFFTKVAFFCKRVFWFFWDNKRITIICLAILVLLIAGVFTYRGCKARRVRLNQQEIIDAQKAIATEDRKAMEKILVDSDVREKQINENLVNAKTETVNAIAEAKKKASQMTNEQLAEELNRRAREE